MAEVKLARVEEHPFGITWQIDEPGARTSHALRVDGRVWIVDPVEHPAALDELERRFAHHLLGAWSAGESSLLRPIELPAAVAGTAASPAAPAR